MLAPYIKRESNGGKQALVFQRFSPQIVGVMAPLQSSPSIRWLSAATSLVSELKLGLRGNSSRLSRLFLDFELLGEGSTGAKDQPGSS